MLNISNIINSSEEARKFLAKFPKNEHELAVRYTFLFGITVLNQYKSPNLTSLKQLVKSTQIVTCTEQTVKDLQEKMLILQQEIAKLDNKTELPEKCDKATETRSFNDNNVAQTDDLWGKKSSKKVDFWNQTENKENFEDKSSRAAWKKPNETNWAYDFSSEVKRIPQLKNPIIIRESRISILSNQSKSRLSSLDNYF
ncbi:hypothetical protein SteCoe_20844 [Stentor coeruleus]|uniref:Uncharacterized protein n=1 Tax=Stentor coeruleus TaxID=5963 RepID=A0A1R2BQW6_9CILI|nr:hypothetical protein SteCoe_20844 [Stentor coeruleus]